VFEELAITDPVRGSGAVKYGIFVNSTVMVLPAGKSEMTARFLAISLPYPPLGAGIDCRLRQNLDFHSAVAVSVVAPAD